MTSSTWIEDWSARLFAEAELMVGDVADLEFEEPVSTFAIRLAMTSRTDADRIVFIDFSEEWVEAVSTTDPQLGLPFIDDFTELDDYTIGRVGQLLDVARVYLVGGGSPHTRRTILGRRRSRLTLTAGSSTWTSRPDALVQITPDCGHRTHGP